MTDPDRRATMDVLTVLTSPALFTEENLFRLVVCRMAALSLEHGNSDGSCLAYAWLGSVLGMYFGDIGGRIPFRQAWSDLVETAGRPVQSACLPRFAVHASTGRRTRRSAAACCGGLRAAQVAGDLLCSLLPPRPGDEFPRIRIRSLNEREARMDSNSYGSCRSD
jgi:hypothetical protein